LRVNKTDVVRIKELLESSLFRDSIQNKVRRIMKEMPHLNLTTDGLAEVVKVHAEHKRREIAELAADAKARHQIAEIINEAEAFNLRDALDKLGHRASKGDGRAQELLHKVRDAIAVVQVVD
jgi:methyl-accepting chemotaxis protein